MLESELFQQSKSCTQQHRLRGQAIHTLHQGKMFPVGQWTIVLWHHQIFKSYDDTNQEHDGQILAGW